MGFILATIVIVRLLVPFVILRWPFWGLIVVNIADALDFTIWYGLGVESFDTVIYQRSDKFLDTYSLFFMLYVSSQLEEIRARKTLVGLFSWRFIGFLLFEITGARKFLFFAPNVFELFYAVIFGIKKFAPKISINSRKNLLIIFAVTIVPKLVHEYILHFLEYPLGFRSGWKLFTNWAGGIINGNSGL